MVFDQQGFDYCGLECQGDVIVGLFVVVVGFDVMLLGVQGKGFEFVEVEVQVGVIGYWLWEYEVVRSVEFCQVGDFWIVGIVQVDQFGGFVEGFVGGVVY